MGLHTQDVPAPTWLMPQPTAPLHLNRDMRKGPVQPIHLASLSCQIVDNRATQQPALSGLYV